MTSRPIVDQFTPTLSARDAIGNHVVAVADALHDSGFEPRVFAANVEAGVRIKAHSYLDHGDMAAADLLIAHHSIGSPVTDYLLSRPEPLALWYHNITPARFFDRYEPHIAGELDHGRRQLRRVARRAKLGLADSEFNADELREMKCRSVSVVPIMFDNSWWDDVAVVPPAPQPGSVWLFVGRVAPNKCQHDIVTAFGAYRRLFDPDARLVLVGGPSSAGYQGALDRLISELDLESAVTRAGSVPVGELAGWFGRSDVFVCLSEHEGFCVPLLEAMHHRVPIVAFDSTAVGETLGGAGLVIKAKDPVDVAVAAHRVVSDSGVADRLVAAGRRRLEDFNLDRTRALLVDAIAPLVGRPEAVKP